jgi:hypothetical protein
VRFIDLLMPQVAHPLLLAALVGQPIRLEVGSSHQTVFGNDFAGFDVNFGSSYILCYVEIIILYNMYTIVYIYIHTIYYTIYIFTPYTILIPHTHYTGSILYIRIYR